MSGRKAFIVKVELDVQAVTCPGVWLCSNGQVSLQLYMLDSCVQTSCLRPSFPMLFHEQFIFSKTLPTKYHLEDLSKQLSREWLYVELIQWEDCQCGNVLAYFQIPLNEFLYPTVSGGIPSGAEVDLLMETTPAFPGPLAPKLEVINRTTIEETICSCNRQKLNTCLKMDPKPLTICDCAPRKQNVCHCCPNKTYRNRKCPCGRRCKAYDRPPWRYKKVEDGFLQRKPVLHLPPKPTPQLELDGGIDGGPYGGPRRRRQDSRKSRSRSMPNIFDRVFAKFGSRTQPDRGMEVRRVLQESLKRAICNAGSTNSYQQDRICTCVAGHLEAACPLCQKYNGVFSSKLAQQDHPRQMFFSTVNPDKSLYNQLRRQSKRNESEDDICVDLNSAGNFGSSCKAHCNQPSVYTVTSKFPELNESLTKRIHDRVSKTLGKIPGYVDEIKDMCMDVGGCQLSDSNECTCSKLPDMGQFYRELYEEEFGKK